LGSLQQQHTKLFPNPVQADLNVQYTILNDGVVKLSIFDVLGREMGVFIDEFQQEGYYSSVIDLGSFRSGLYLYTFTINGTEKTGKILIE